MTKTQGRPPGIGPLRESKGYVEIDFPSLKNPYSLPKDFTTLNDFNSVTTRYQF